MTLSLTPQRQKRWSFISGSLRSGNNISRSTFGVKQWRWRVTRSAQLTWSTNTFQLDNKTQQRLWKVETGQTLAKSAAELPQNRESIFTNVACYASCTAAERKDLHRAVQTAQQIVENEILHLGSAYATRMLASEASPGQTECTITLSSAKQSLIWRHIACPRAALHI